MNLASGQRQYDHEHDEAGDIAARAAEVEAAEYETWCEARTPSIEADAMRDFLLQHRRATGPVTGTYDAGSLKMATVSTDTFSDWIEWDKRTNFRKRGRN